MEEKKTEDRTEVKEIADSEDMVRVSEEPEESGTAEDGESGPKKRERNENMMAGIYAVAGVYLLYTVYQSVKALIQGEVAPGRDTILNIVFTVIFSVAAVWILRMTWKMRKDAKAREKAEAEAARIARGEEPEEPVKTSAIGNIIGNPELKQSSVASRASVYYNPADEDEEDESDDEDFREKADGEESRNEEPEAGEEAGDREEEN